MYVSFIFIEYNSKVDCYSEIFSKKNYVLVSNEILKNISVMRNMVSTYLL